MFLGKNRFANQGTALGGAGVQDVGENTQFLSQTNRPMPNGMQRFLAKKGINSSDDLNNRLQSSPRMAFRKGR